MFKKFISSFFTTLCLVLLCLNSMAGTFVESVAGFNGGFNSVDLNKSVYLEVIDTIKGLPTYYNLNQKLDLNKAKLVLIDPNSKMKQLDSIKYSSSISPELINVVGKYSLVLGYKVNSQYKVIANQLFNVESDVATALSSEFGVGGDGDRFRFKAAPNSVAPFKDFSLTVEALNASGQLDTNYTGTIIFESTDSNAQLPEEYTFAAGDAGERTFMNAFYLTSIGSTKITVKDKNNSSLLGELDLSVAVAANNQTSSNTGTIVVDSPTSGTVTSNRVNFIGTVDPGLEVEVFDKGVFLTKGNADAAGKFNIASTALPDGTYEFVLKTSNAESSVINLVISTAGSNVSSVVLNPVSPVAGTNAEITVTFNSEVNSVSAIISGRRNVLEAIDQTKKIYRGTIVVPSEATEYPVNLDVVSALGVRAEVQDALKFTVLPALNSANDSNISFNVPTKVTGLNAVSEDRKVVLSWAPATAVSGIDYYKIYYGTAPDRLNLSIDTNDTNTTWFVPDLENQVRYYFSVYGVDMEGNESDQGSDIITAIPGVSGSVGLHGSADGQVLVDSTAETGPGLWLVLFITGVISYLYRKYNLRSA